MRACGETTLEAGEQQVREIQREGAWSVSSTGSVAPAVITLGRQEAQVSRQERSEGPAPVWGGEFRFHLKTLEESCLVVQW